MGAPPLSCQICPNVTRVLSHHCSGLVRVVQQGVAEVEYESVGFSQHAQQSLMTSQLLELP